MDVSIDLDLRDDFMAASQSSAKAKKEKAKRLKREKEEAAAKPAANLQKVMAALAPVTSTPVKEEESRRMMGGLVIQKIVKETPQPK